MRGNLYSKIKLELLLGGGLHIPTGAKFYICTCIIVIVKLTIQRGGWLEPF